MESIAEQAVATAPGAVAAIRQNFERQYAPTLSFLAGLPVSWRIEAEAQVPSEPQYQVVFWATGLPTGYTLKLRGVQAEGTLTSITGAVLSATELLEYVGPHLDEWVSATLAQKQRDEQLVARANKLRRVMALVALAAFILYVAAALAFGPSNWVDAGRDTTILLILMTAALDSQLPGRRW